MSATRPPAFDDRFSTPIEASRRGAHRARPKPVSAGLPVAAGAAVILLVLGGGYVMLKGTNSVSESSSNQVAAGAVPDEGPSASGTKVAAPPASDTKTDAADDPDAKGGGTGAKADKTIPIKVLNSGVVAGLAARKGADLDADGWKISSTGTAAPGDRGRALSRIYYGSSAIKGTAAALKRELGYGTLLLNSTVADPKEIVLLLGKDAE